MIEFALATAIVIAILAVLHLNNLLKKDDYVITKDPFNIIRIFSIIVMVHGIIGMIQYVFKV